MPSIPLILPALLVAAFACAAWLEPWFRHQSGNRSSSADVMTVLMGDSRQLFARHFYLKADAYFHGGYYPSIFETHPKSDCLGSTASHESHDHETEHKESSSVEPDDWLHRFSGHFYPSEHRHLGHEPEEPPSAHANPHSETASADRPGDERELLPWLRLAATLDPKRPEFYVVASFWLRTQLGKVDEAEQFLREGLRHNPGDSEILFELGRIYREHRQDPQRARTLWELGLTRWRELETPNTEPNRLLYAQLLGNLATLEEETGRYPEALAYVRELLPVSPHQASLRRWIEALEAKVPR